MTNDNFEDTRKNKDYIRVMADDFQNLNFEVNVKSTGIKICPCCKIADCKDEKCSK